MKTKVCLLISLVFLFACQNTNDDIHDPESDQPPAFIARHDIVLTSTEQELSVQTNTFAFNLFKTVYANEDADENILLSPLSATFAFLMLNNGAAGTTQEEIQQTLGFGDVSREAVNVYAQKLVDAMQTLDTRTTVESANSIWIQNHFTVFDAFKQVNVQYYEAEIQNVDFGKKATLDRINGWVNDKTHGKIESILDDFPHPLTRLILLNALYFKGDWTIPFYKQFTSDAVFRNSAGAEQIVPTMQKNVSRYARAGNFSAVELPFGNGAFSVVVALPDEGTPLPEAMEQIDGDWWEQITSFDKFAYELALQKRYYAVHLKIPRFKVEYERSLNDDLIALGMESPFMEDDADFSLISPFPLFVSNVKQKTFARMDEVGMEAAAVTMIGMLSTSPGPGPEPVKIDFKVDRPFLFFIKENSTNLVFFSGVINKIE